MATALVPGWCGAQNLVPNGSFEDFTECPDNFGQLERSVGWYAANFSPDYYNGCGLLGNPMDVPQSYCGYQQAATGVAYIGLATYWEEGVLPVTDQANEAVAAYLSEPLVVGQTVHLSMKVSSTLSMSIGCANWVVEV